MRIAYLPQLTNLHWIINIARGYGLQKGSLLVCVTSVDSLGAHKRVMTHLHHYSHLRVFSLPLNILNCYVCSHSLPIIHVL